MTARFVSGYAVVIPFTILGQVLARTGGARFFADIAMAAMGRFRGGAGKIACYAFSQTNTNLANVVTTTPTWVDVGGAKAGLTGLPVLTGLGDLSANSANQISLSNARPSSTATLAVGITALNAPFKGGLMVPDPIVLLALPTSAAGAASLPFLWPTGIPAGFPIWFQFWIQDAAASFGLSASNGLKGIAG